MQASDSVAAPESTVQKVTGAFDTISSPVRSDARTKFVRGASLIREIIGRKINRVSIPGLSITKILLLFGSIVLIIITISFYRTRRDHDRFMTTTRLSIMDKEVQRACRFIEDHYDDPELDLRKICDALVTGGAFLEALFVNELGLSIEDFIGQVRINRAKITLRKEPGIPVDDLAHSVGFSSEETFTDKFSAISGTGIAAYRKALGRSGDAPE